MQVLDGVLVHSASDLNDYTECLHLTALERRVAARELTRPEVTSETAKLLARKGDEHERRYLDRLREQFGADLVAFESRSGRSRTDYLEADAATLRAMAAGTKIIYQAAFFDGTFLGRADFLRRIEVPSARFAWSYEVIETKLALSPKPYFLVQLAQYSEHVARLQGSMPAEASIVLGSGNERRFPLEECAAYYRRLKADYLASFARDDDAYPFECAHCDLCPWRVACATRRDADDHLSLVARIRRDQIAKLEDHGIGTLAALASAPDDARPKRMQPESFDNLRSQAREQHRYRAARAAGGSASHSYTFRLPAGPNDGFGRLPEPDPGDVFFDMEGDPLYRPDRPLEYLFGCYLPAEDRYVPFWGKTPAEERTAFEAFVDFVVDRRRTYPNLHVYHYAPYETVALKRLGGLFGSRERELDAFWEAGTFVDLYPVVRQSVWISQPSYSIKKVEALYGFTRTTVTKGGDDSIVQFEAWLATQDAAILDDIRAYNDDDCRSTFLLRQWLVRLRAERNATLDVPTPWRIVSTPESSRAAEGAAAADTTLASGTEADAEAADRDALRAWLLDAISPPDSLAELRRWPEERRCRWLLGNLLEYHRREQKPEWWEFFHRRDHIGELEEHDGKAIGGLRYRPDVPPYKKAPRDRNLVHVFDFPKQEFDLSAGDEPLDPSTGKRAGEIVEIVETDAEVDRLHLKLAASIDASRLSALIPGKPLDDSKKRRLVARIARDYLDGSLERDHPATFELVHARAPRLRDRGRGSTIQPDVITPETVTAVIEALDSSHVVVQGPPGSGKSTTAAHAVVALLTAGKRVALAAQSHKALHNLCRKIEQTAHGRGYTFSGCHKSSDSNAGSAYESYALWKMIGDAPKSSAFDDCTLVSATTYAWADPGQNAAFDTIFVDEAGQLSIADVLIASLVARNVVLLGDPQQLPQVLQGSHPIGTDLSILEHLLGDAPTIRPERGVFLSTSYRMQPDVDRFISATFYQGRLDADPRNAGNRVEGGDDLAGGGPRHLAIDHDGNGRVSIEEASALADRIAELLTHGRVALRTHDARRIVPADILVVAPYNMQRVAIERELRLRGIAGVPVGTVDKFQGLEAPIVFYSMATSSAELAPRGLDFLISPNRLNVAISRSQVLSVLVCSPLLLASRAGTVDALRLLNLLCRYVEAAASSGRAVAVGGAEADAPVSSAAPYSNRTATIGSSRDAFAAG